jgi:crotonobetainyl-CoA:carnitine CoA-transferase CaiB-like acyl-CoA transferase
MSMQAGEGPAQRSGPLTAIRILDFTTYQAGAQGTGILADLGADVIKVEDTRRGDDGRVLYLTGPPDNRQSAFFYVCNRGKRSVALDLKRPEGIAVIDRLVRQVDVVANNFRPGVMERLNLAYDRLAGINPRIVYVSMTGWGKRGPKARHPALDTAAQARGGIVWQTGEPDGFPLPAGAAVADHAAALNLAIAILAGIVARDRTGQGQEIDVSLYGSVLELQATEMTYSFLSGKQLPRAGRGHPLLPTLTRVFQAADGYLAIIGVEDTRWPGFCRAVERPDLEHDERFKDTRTRKRNMEALCAELDRVFPTKSTAEWIAHLEKEDQVCSPVQSYASIAQDPVALDNDHIVELTNHPRLPKGKVVSVPYEFHGTHIRRDLIDPTVGEHTREILAEAGLTEGECDTLLASAVARAAK